MKIWILRERLDWHNTDPDDETKAFSKKEDALKALTKEFRKVKKWFDEIEWEEVGDDYARFETSREDYYNSWIEEIEIK